MKKATFALAALALIALAGCTEPKDEAKEAYDNYKGPTVANPKAPSAAGGGGAPAPAASAAPRMAPMSAGTSRAAN